MHITNLLIFENTTIMLRIAEHEIAEHEIIDEVRIPITTHDEQNSKTSQQTRSQMLLITLTKLLYECHYNTKLHRLRELLTTALHYPKNTYNAEAKEFIYFLAALSHGENPALPTPLVNSNHGFYSLFLAFALKNADFL